MSQVSLQSGFGAIPLGIFGDFTTRPGEGLTLKIEYDSHEYTNEALENILPDTGPINLDKFSACPVDRHWRAARSKIP